MNSIEVACPMCATVFTFDGDAINPPAGTIVQIICKACRHKGPLHQFEKALRQIRQADERRIDEQRREEARSRELADKRERARLKREEEQRVQDAQRVERERLRTLHDEQVRAEAESRRKQIKEIRAECYEIDPDDPPTMELYGIMAAAASLFCFIAAGALLSIQAQTRDSIMEAIAHGLGFYCIGKGLFLGPALWATARNLTRKRIARTGGLDHLRLLEEQRP